MNARFKDQLKQSMEYFAKLAIGEKAEKPFFLLRMNDADHAHYVKRMQEYLKREATLNQAKITQDYSTMNASRIKMQQIEDDFYMYLSGEKADARPSTRIVTK